MKRSEMVATLEFVFRETDLSIDDYYLILDIVEKNGMLPPRTKLGVLEIEDNAWEPENET